MKTIITLILLIGIGGGAWWWFHRGKEEEVHYQTAAIGRGELTQVVTATGTLNPVVNVQVGSQISGNIKKLAADFNSPVKAGEMVAQLDPAIYQAIVHQAEGDLANSKAQWELAKLTAKRKEDLVTQHAAAQADLDSALAALHQSEAAVKMKEANLEKARVDLDHCTIYSPIDGTVISRQVDVGQTVAASMNAPVIFTIANDLTKMQIDSNVAEADVGNVEVDQTVEFLVDAYPGRTFHGKVAQVRNAAVVTQNVVTYDVVVAVDNADLKLKPGMTANVSIVIAHRDDALKLPNAALRFRPPDLVASTPAAAPVGGPGAGGGGPRGPGGGGGGRGPGGGGGRRGPGAGARGERTIYVLNGSKPEPVKAKLGITDGIFTEVLEGFKEGDLVVTGMEMPQTASTPAPGGPARNPLSGGGPRFR